MSYDWTLWGLFILLGLATTLPRASFIVLGERAALPESLQKALRYAPATAAASRGLNRVSSPPDTKMSGATMAASAAAGAILC